MIKYGKYIRPVCLPLGEINNFVHVYLWLKCHNFFIMQEQEKNLIFLALEIMMMTLLISSK